MANQSSGRRLQAILWFVAAGLAFIALAISLSDGKPNISVGVGGIFCLIMGIAALQGQKPPSP